MIYLCLSVDSAPLRKRSDALVLLFLNLSSRNTCKRILIYPRTDYLYVTTTIEEFSWKNYWKEITAVALALVIAYYFDWKFIENLNQTWRFLGVALGIWYILKAVEPTKEHKKQQS